VISAIIYKKLRAENPAVAGLFQKADDHTYYTELGYQAFITRQEQKELNRDNKQKNYNGAWRQY
jgi:hypothetical protein